MKNIFLQFITLLIFFWPTLSFGANLDLKLSGYILLQVENNGEAWYVYPTDAKRYYLGRPDDALLIMKKLALGATHEYITNTTIFPARLSGLILLDTESKGEAYYIYPKDNKKYYLGRPKDAFSVMKSLGRGITNSNLGKISVNPKNEKILQDVPFTSQAPFGKWSDLRQEDGCEEAAALMAIKWARGESLSKDEALKEIIASSDYILKKYGEYRDIYINDVLNWVIKDYFDYQKAVLKNDISLDDIIGELNKGNIIIAPMNGQLLNNPNFKAPGPPNHMILIRAYDPAKKTFITNDPGTRKGELYEYDSNLLYKAIRSYPTGNKELITELKKDMIVFWK